MKWASATGDFVCTDNVLEAAKDADVLYTDVWASMGQEAEAETRRQIFAGYQINDSVMAVARSPQAPGYTRRNVSTSIHQYIHFPYM